MAGVEVRTLTDGGQPAEDTAHALAAFFAGAEKSIDIAIYDVNLPEPVRDIARDFGEANEPIQYRAAGSAGPRRRR